MKLDATTVIAGIAAIYVVGLVTNSVSIKNNAIGIVVDDAEGIQPERTFATNFNATPGRLTNRRIGIVVDDAEGIQPEKLFALDLNATAGRLTTRNYRYHSNLN